MPHKINKNLDPAEFIRAVRESFIGAEIVYREGSCFMLYRMVKLVFPDAVPWYSEEQLHCIFAIDGRFFDIGGPCDCGPSYKPDTEERYASVSVAVALPKKKTYRRRFVNKTKLSDLDII